MLTPGSGRVPFAFHPQIVAEFYAQRAVMHEEHGSNTILLMKTSGLGEISLCGCGVVSLHLGSAIPRMEGNALLEVESMIRRALESLCELAAEQRLPENAKGAIQ